ncbi:conserved hypothetical protein [uncultured Eubacteriales bacterium]|uniref:N-acetyltransferase domain-containing protein n=1 Tax=uncultured Eubacteriales bacterium TaxID=172733 RepID=A0A212IVK9_9FIRM|nr:conserved hypothetical protein [uncultured Eubacteriales bacterium]
MPGKFQFKKFAEIDLDDPFFDTLKSDYPKFSQWYQNKARSGSTALVFNDEEGLGAFVYLKSEDEPIKLVEFTLPAIRRKKIGTLKLAERYQGQRLGEGALGLALWDWRKSQEPEIYVTVFEKHSLLVSQLVRFGFRVVGHKANGESVYLKSRFAVDYSDPFKSFPFINPSFKKAGYLIVNDYYHDTLFPYSELSRTMQESMELSAANGISKVYVGSQFSPHYQVGEPIFIYRRHTKEDGQKPRYKSCLTSYCMVTNIICVKKNGRYLLPFDELLERIGNKSVFNKHDMQNKYQTEKHMVVIEMLYYGYFGGGNNINMDWLAKNGYWATQNQYPANVQLSPAQFKEILLEGNVDVQNVIIH